MSGRVAPGKERCLEPIASLAGAFDNCNYSAYNSVAILQVERSVPCPSPGRIKPIAGVYFAKQKDCALQP
jgi:hypothetical protein